MPAPGTPTSYTDCPGAISLRPTWESCLSRSDMVVRHPRQLPRKGSVAELPSGERRRARSLRRAATGLSKAEGSVVLGEAACVDAPSRRRRIDQLLQRRFGDEGQMLRGAGQRARQIVSKATDIARSPAAGNHLAVRIDAACPAGATAFLRRRAHHFWKIQPAPSAVKPESRAGGSTPTAPSTWGREHREDPASVHHLLDRLQLHRRIEGMPQRLAGTAMQYSKAIPGSQHHQPQRSLGMGEVPVPSEGHEDVGGDEQQDRQQEAGETRRRASRASRKDERDADRVRSCPW